MAFHGVRKKKTMLAEKVISVIAETQKIPEEGISLETTFDDLGLDSLDGLNILFEIENAYDIDINIPNDRVGSMRNVGELVATLEEILSSDSLNEAQADTGDS